MSDAEVLEAVKASQARQAPVPAPANAEADEITFDTDATATTDKPASLIPPLSERPCWRVLEDWAVSEGGKLRPGVWFFGIKNGKGNAPQSLTETYVCGPLHIVAVTTNANDSAYGRLLRFKTTLGRWKTWAMPMELLKGDGADLRGELLDMGLELDPMARHLLPQYIQHRTPKQHIRCTEQTGWAGGHCMAFVLPDKVIGPDAAGVVYQSGERSSDEFTMGGTLAGWQSGIAAQSVRNPLLTLSICTAFAGPLLARCNAESGGIHLVGDSSTGKSTAIEAARSVWGGPGYKRSWRTTGNGLEGAAALFNDCLLALDEISECDPREVGAIVYSLGNGRGKQRAGRSGAARHVKTWRCSVISSGERTIGTTMMEGGHRIKAGQSVRLLDVPVQRQHGAWDELHAHLTGHALSDDLKRQANIHFGHAGRAFLVRVTCDESDFSQALETIKAMPEFSSGTDADGQVKRAAARFALLGLAGELATDYGVTQWPEGEAIAAAAVGFEAWKMLRGDNQNSHEHRQILERLTGFLERHGDSRFTDKNATIDPARATLVRDRAGWYEGTHEGRTYLFTASGLKEALRGFDFERAKTVLQTAGVMPQRKAGGKRADPVRIAGEVVRVYTVHQWALYPEGDQS